MKYNDIKDSQKQDEYLAALMKQQFDQELKDKWAGQLKSEYGVQSNSQTVNSSSLMRRLFPYVGGIAACLIVFFAYHYGIEKDTVNPNSFLLTEINNPIIHPGNTKGIAEDNQARQTGIAQFNEQKFEEAAFSFSQIESKNLEAQYYQATALFYNKNFDQAIPIYRELQTKESSMAQEVNWFLSLSYLGNEDFPAAKRTLDGILENEWKYAKAQELLKSL